MGSRSSLFVRDGISFRGWVACENVAETLSVITRLMECNGSADYDPLSWIHYIGLNRFGRTLVSGMNATTDQYLEAVKRSSGASLFSCSEMSQLCIRKTTDLFKKAARLA